MKMKIEKIDEIIDYDFKLNHEQMDCLKELGNIGSGNAIVALSKLLDQKVEVSLTSVKVIDFWDLSEKLGGPNCEVFGIISDVSEQPNILFLYIFTKKSILNMIKLLSGKEFVEFSDLENLDDFSFSIISEIGNILTGHYSSAIANLLQLKLIPKVPKVSYDSLGAIIEYITAKSVESIDSLVTINTQLKIEKINLHGFFCIIPSIRHIPKIFSALNNLIEI